MNYYSQYGEDKVFGNLLPNLGRVLEIGAWSPTIFSNSRHLIERGWRAVLVDFSPGVVRGLVEEYGKPEWEERVQVLQAAVTVDGHGSLECFDVTDDGLSTSTPAIKEKWAEKGGYFGKLWVPRLSLHQLLFQFGGDFQCVSIDTEGTSVDLAIHFIRELQQRPTVLIVEHDDRAMELLENVKEFGYTMVDGNGTNAVLARL